MTADPENGFPDQRLALLFACAHPAIDPVVRAPLMLQAVLGIGRDADCQCISRFSGGDGAAAGARQNKDSRCAHSVSRPRTQRVSRAA